MPERCRSHFLCVAGLGLSIALAGCASDSIETPTLAETTQNPAPAAPTTAPAAPADSTPVVATVNGEAITLEEMARPMIASEGWATLVCLLQLHVAKQAAAKAEITVTPADIQAEYQKTLAAYFTSADPSDYDRLLDALLPKMTPPMTRPQFMIAVEADAYFRKLIANQTPDIEKSIDEKNLQKIFAVRYGAKVQIRCIEVPTRQEAEQAKARLAAGESFNRLAAELNMNQRLRDTQGLLEPFNTHATTVPEPVIQAAFLLDDGKISDVIQGPAAYYLIKMESHIAPKIVSYEKVRQSLKDEMLQGMIQVKMNELRDKLTQQALDEGLTIVDPQLREIYQEALQREKGMTSQEKIRRRILEEQHRNPGEIDSIRDNTPATKP